MSAVSARPRRGAVVGAMILALLAFPGPAWSKTGAATTVDGKKAELQELQAHINALRDELGRAESHRSDAADQLQETETAISSAAQRLRQLAQARAEAATALAAAQSESSHLERTMLAQQSQLAVLLKRHYVAGQADSLNHMLGGDNPNQAARDAVYLQALSKAKARLVADLKESLARKAALATEASRRAAELATIEVDSRTEQAQLEQERAQHRALLEKLSDRIRQQRREIDKLKDDEQRMGRLVQGLARITQAHPPAQVQAPLAPVAPVPEAARPTSAPATAAKPAADDTPRPSAPVVLEAGSFARLKGRLTLPIKGELVHRFGSPRTEGASWKGVFVKAASGDVRALASGRVVFADWLRGFGNLIIVDHGDDYLSVYGNNESLFRKVGETVAAGDALAAVGNSGGNRETGLYFELRHQGQTVDPMKWIVAR